MINLDFDLGRSSIDSVSKTISLPIRLHHLSFNEVEFISIQSDTLSRSFVSRIVIVDENKNQIGNRYQFQDDGNGLQYLFLVIDCIDLINPGTITISFYFKVLLDNKREFEWKFLITIEVKNINGLPSVGSKTKLKKANVSPFAFWNLVVFLLLLVVYLLWSWQSVDTYSSSRSVISIIAPFVVFILAFFAIDIQSFKQKFKSFKETSTIIEYPELYFDRYTYSLFKKGGVLIVLFVVLILELIFVWKYWPLELNKGDKIGESSVDYYFKDKHSVIKIQNSRIMRMDLSNVIIAVPEINKGVDSLFFVGRITQIDWFHTKNEYYRFSYLKDCKDTIKISYLDLNSINKADSNSRPWVYEISKYFAKNGFTGIANFSAADSSFETKENGCFKMTVFKSKLFKIVTSYDVRKYLSDCKLEENGFSKSDSIGKVILAAYDECISQGVIDKRQITSLLDTIIETEKFGIKEKFTAIYGLIYTLSNRTQVKVDMNNYLFKLFDTAYTAYGKDDLYQFYLYNKNECYLFCYTLTYNSCKYNDADEYSKAEQKNILQILKYRSDQTPAKDILVKNIFAQSAILDTAGLIMLKKINFIVIDTALNINLADKYIDQKISKCNNDFHKLPLAYKYYYYTVIKSIKAREPVWKDLEDRYNFYSVPL